MFTGFDSVHLALGSTRVSVALVKFLRPHVREQEARCRTRNSLTLTPDDLDVPPNASLHAYKPVFERRRWCTWTAP